MYFLDLMDLSCPMKGTIGGGIEGGKFLHSRAGEVQS